MGQLNSGNRVPQRLTESVEATALLIRTIRRERGWSIAQMSRSTGLHENRLRDYEKGKRRPSSASWLAILKAVGTDPTHLDVLLAATGDISEAFSDPSCKREPRSKADFLAGLLPDLQGLLRATNSTLDKLAFAATSPPPYEDQVRRLMLLDRSRRADVIRITTEFQTYPLSVFCCKRSISAAATEPGIAREIAELAVTVSNMVKVPWQGRLRANALVHVGNADRVLGDVDHAEVLFDEAEPLWESSPEDPGILDPGRILQLKASLRRDQGRLDEALPMIDRAERISVAIDRVLITRATILEKIGRYPEALDALDRADSLLARRETRDEWLLCLGRGVNLAYSGCYYEARRFAEAAKSWAGQTGHALDALRTDWFCARLLGATGNAADARNLFDQVRNAFSKRGMLREVALVNSEYYSLGD